jgi:copper/silver efflux system protein
VGVVIARYGDNPLKTIQNVKDKISEISPGLPSKTLEDGTVSKVTVVPFYDRTELIYETLGTLNEAISLQILITIIVIIIMVFHLRASIMISALLPMAVLMCFIMMKYMKIDANIVALSGIAIAIGTMVDLGIILSENILRHTEEAPPEQSMLTTVYNAASEVSSAILTAVSTTIVSFLPVFTLQAAEGKLFGPLAYTKTFALLAALIITLFMMPAFAHWLFSIKATRKYYRLALNLLLTAAGVIMLWWSVWAGVMLILLGVNNIIGYLAVQQKLPSSQLNKWVALHHNTITIAIVAVGVSWLLAREWMPLGVSNSLLLNFIFIAIILGTVLGGFKLFILFYPKILNWCLEHKRVFLLLPVIIILLGINIWLGFAKVFGFIPQITDKTGWNIRTTSVWSKMAHTFPGLEKEFMPALDEGSFLLMPTSMPHSGIEANIKYLQQLDLRVQAIPEVSMVVGKQVGLKVHSIRHRFRCSKILSSIKLSISMMKTDIPIRFRVDNEGNFERDENGELIPFKRGQYFRQWRDHIRTPDDIWNEIVNATNNIPGVTSAPKLQPIETRLVMLQTGMRAPMGIKVFGPDLKSIEDFSLEVEQLLKEVPSVKPEAVYADRSLGKPYLEIEIDRNAIARYGLNIADVQMYLEVAMGGMPLTTTVEGRERYNIRARYARESRDNIEAINRILIPVPTGQQIPLSELATIEYRPGPGMIRGENSFLVGYILLDKKDGFSEVTVVEHADNFLKDKIASGELVVPAGVSYQFSGSYENQIRAEKRLAIVVPLVLAVIFLILYFQFRSTTTSLMIFSAILLAFAGGFLMLWLYSETWFLDFSLFGTNMRELFQMKTYNLSVAVWVGFIALFGIATDDGVVISTYLMQSFKKHKPENIKEVRIAVLEAGMKRVRPCLMTTATTLLALLPILTSTGRGSDIMIPMAIPAFGGMTVALITLFVVPVLYAAREEYLIKKNSK